MMPASFCHPILNAGNVREIDISCNQTVEFDRASSPKEEMFRWFIDFDAI